MTEHPDAETLSAYFDGEAPEWGPHVRACPECRAQLDKLERVRAAVGAPVPQVDPGTRETAIRAAVAADDITPADTDRRMPRWAALGAVAAVVLGIIVGVAATRDSGSKQQFASERAASGPVSAQIVNAGDLGDVNDGAALQSKVSPAVAGGTAAAGLSGQSAAAPQSRAADATKQTETAGTIDVACEAEARAMQPGTEVLVYRATATWQGTPAVVLGFSPEAARETTAPGRRPPTRVYVLSRSGCQLLSFQSYAP